MIVFDASVLIAHLESGDAHHAQATNLLLTNADETFRASPLTIAEVLVGPARTGQLGAGLAALAKLGLMAVDLTADAPERLATLRANTNLKLPDCCVLFAAQTIDASVATFDQELAKAARHLGLAAIT